MVFLDDRFKNPEEMLKPIEDGGFSVMLGWKYVEKFQRITSQKLESYLEKKGFELEAEYWRYKGKLFYPITTSCRYLGEDENGKIDYWLWVYQMLTNLRMIVFALEKAGENTSIREILDELDSDF